MIKGGSGGGNTITGLFFEARTDLKQLFNNIEGYQLIDTGKERCGYQVWFKGECQHIVLRGRNCIGSSPKSRTA